MPKNAAEFLDEAASPREGERFGSVVRGWRGPAVAGFWRVIGFRPLRLDFVGSYEGVSRCQDSEIASSRTCSSPGWWKGPGGSIFGPFAN